MNHRPTLMAIGTPTTLRAALNRGRGRHWEGFDKRIYDSVTHYSTNGDNNAMCATRAGNHKRERESEGFAAVVGGGMRKDISATSLT